MNEHDLCANCFFVVSRDCPVCERSLTRECFGDNELVCIFCLEDEDDPDYVPNSDDEGDDTDTDETGSTSGSDTSTDDDE
jgi:hypothetical protein